MEKEIRVMSAFGYATEEKAVEHLDMFRKKYPAEKGWILIWAEVRLSEKSGCWHAHALFRRERKRA